MSEYNGHPSYEHWNVSLWVNNDQGLYEIALESSREHFIDLCWEHFRQTPDHVRVLPELAGYAWDSVHEDEL